MTNPANDNYRFIDSAGLDPTGLDDSTRNFDDSREQYTTSTPEERDPIDFEHTGVTLPGGEVPETVEAAHPSLFSMERLPNRQRVIQPRAWSAQLQANGALYPISKNMNRKSLFIANDANSAGVAFFSFLANGAVPNSFGLAPGNKPLELKVTDRLFLWSTSACLVYFYEEQYGDHSA